MKAWQLHAIGNLKLEEMTMPQAGEGEVLLKIKACGVCGSDIPRIYSKGTYSFPTVPGHEFSGEIAAVGEGVDPALIGRGAAVFPLLPCKNCDACQIGQYAFCSNYDYMGSRSDGAFAEYIAVPLWNVLFIPEGVSFEEAAMVEPAAVAIHALRQANTAIGDEVLIFGAGPIGMILAQWAKASGAAKVMLVDIDEEKLQFANQLGISLTCNSKAVDALAWVKEQTDGHGASVVIEGSGSSAAYEQAMHAAKVQGRVVLMGNPAGDMILTQQGYWAIMRKSLTVVGTWNSNYANWPMNEWKLVLQYLANGSLNLQPLITHRYALEDLELGLHIMRDKSEFAMKVMFINED